MTKLLENKLIVSVTACNIFRTRRGVINKLLPALLLAVLVMSLSIGNVTAQTPQQSTALPGAIPIGKNPQGIAFNPVTNRMYVASASMAGFRAGFVSVIDANSNEVTASIKVPDAYDIGVDSSSNLIYVSANYCARCGTSIVVINGSTNQIQEIPFPYLGSDLFAVNVKTGKFYTDNIDNIIALWFNGSGFTQKKIIIDNVPGRGSLSSIAVNSNTGMVYSTWEDGYLDKLLYTVDTKTDSVTKIPLTLNIYRGAVAVNPNTNLVYVAGCSDWFCFHNKTVLVIDGFSNKILHSLEFAHTGGSVRVIANQNKNLIYVFSNGNNHTSIIDGSTNTLVGDVELPDQPDDLAVNTNTGSVYVTNYYTGSVSVWNPTLTEMVKVPEKAPFEIEKLPNKTTPCCRISPLNFSVEDPEGIALNTNNNLVYVADSSLKVVHVLDPSNNLEVANISVPDSPRNIAFVPSTNLIYAFTASHTYVIDGKTNFVVDTLTNLESSIYNSILAVDQNASIVYMQTDYPCGNITAVWYDGTKHLQKGINFDPSRTTCLNDMAVNPKTGIVYAVGIPPNDFLYAINPSTNEVTKIGLGIEPHSVAVNPDTDLIYVAGEYNAVLVIDGKTNKILPKFIDTLAVPTAEFGGGFSKIAVDPRTNTVYATAYPAGGTSCSLFGLGVESCFYLIYVMDGTSDLLTETVPLPASPRSLAVDSRTGTLYLGVVRESGFANQTGLPSSRNGEVVQILTNRSVIPSKPINMSNIIFRPFLLVNDILPAKMALGHGYHLCPGDTVFLKNAGTAEGHFLLATSFTQGVTFSPDIQTPIKDMEVVYVGDNVVVYSASIAPYESTWVRVPFRCIDPSFVQYTGGDLQQGKYFHVGDRYRLGATVELATLTPEEWTRLNRSYQGADLVGQAVNASYREDSAFYDKISALREDRCGSEMDLQECAQLISGDTGKVSPGLAHYINLLMTESNSNVRTGAGASNEGLGAVQATVSASLADIAGALPHRTPCLAQPLALASDPQGGENTTGSGGENLTTPSAQLDSNCGDKPANFSTSQSAKDFIENEEGYAGKDHPCGPTEHVNCRISNDTYGFYNDPSGYCTTGIGHFIAKMSCQDIDNLSHDDQLWKNKNNSASIKAKADAEKLFDPDLEIHENDVRKNLNPNVSLCQAQFDALVSYNFNAGSHNPSGTLRKVYMDLNQNPPDYDNASSDIAHGANCNDDDHSLCGRRQREAEKFDSCRPGACSQVTAAIDPNSLYANPVGYIRGDRVLDFTVFFENLKNATAPATDVKVVTTIDKSLDLSTFQSLLVSHPDKLQNLTVDTEKRQIVWYFKDILLPPNKNPPEGEGWVRYTIKPLADLDTNTSIKSQARIYFDFNPPIDTNVVEHIIDNDPPVTRIKSLPSQTSSTSFDVGWEGTDKGSGIATVEIRVSVDNESDYQVLDMTGPDTAHFAGELGHTYYFTSIGMDKVGNIEVKSAPDAVVTITNEVPTLLIAVVALVIVVAAGVLLWRRKRRHSA